MEGMHNRMKSTGRTLESDPTLRLKARPGNRQDYEDREHLEKSTFGKRVKAQGSKSGSRSPSEARGNKSKKKLGLGKAAASSSPAKAYRNGTQDTQSKLDSNSDDDELDFLSASSQAGAEYDPSSSQRPVQASKPSLFSGAKPSKISSKHNDRLLTQSEHGYTDKKGNYHEYDPKFPPKKLPGISFKKNKSEETGQDSKSIPSTSQSSSLLPASKENKVPSKSKSAPSNRNNVLDLTLSSPLKAENDSDARSASPLSSRSTNSNRPATPSTASGSRLPLPGRNRCAADDIPRQDPANLRLKIRPRPRPVVKSKTTIDVTDVQPKDRKKGFQSTPPATKVLTQSRSESVQAMSPKPRKRVPAPFPLTAEDMLVDSTPLEETPKAPRSSRRKPQQFPLHSLARDKGKGKANLDVSEDGGDEEEVTKKKPTKLKPKPFPMSKELFSSTSMSPEFFPSGSVGKRSSEAGSGDERATKKSRQSLDKYIHASKGQHIPSTEGNKISIGLSPRVDPRTLCPFCDTPLPSELTPLLSNLLETTRQIARKDPRPTNPLGLKAPFTTYITVCQRHRFETKILPEAEQKGWPKKIKWKKVSGRVLKMKTFLQALIEDPGNDSRSESSDSEWQILATTNSGKSKKRSIKGAKARSIFWTEYMNEVKTKGLRAMSGFQGQYATFDKAQPGYYGEMGYAIIQQTLYNMFPPSEIDPQSILPLTPTEFIQRILVPEVALHLIMEDRNLEGDEGMKEALKILRESSAYGVSMFPEDACEPGASQKPIDETKLGVGDRIVMERARKRRKELEAEDAKEEEEQRRQEELDKIAKEKEAEEKLRKDRELARTEIGSKSSQPEVRPRPRPRPLPADRSKKNVAHSDGMASESTDDTDASTRSGRPVVRRHVASGSGLGGILRGSSDWDMERDHGNRSSSQSRSSASSGSEIEIEEHTTRRPSSEERRRSPSASEPRITRSRAASASDWDSESSRNAVIGTGGRPPNKGLKGRSNSRSKNTARRESLSCDSDSESVDLGKTPIPQKMKPYRDEEETPRPSNKQNLGPLARARARNPERNTLNTGANSKTKEKSAAPPPPAENFSFMFSSDE
ncbi:hypothetical protein JR316_0008329 [Psilocybe cubensis]|uniref:Restriction of telomere capping protein 4 n=2 Tax=Psilocybe cubensis TaxID=181762 RepID=A0A8H7XW40_PSICU|nr:hypothetical protein JR316_0008329 [Psilocybe cubensis]KAH9479734.1 hypothetical protein JR316_0008329 [Psilocybe cubensis]